MRFSGMAPAFNIWALQLQNFMPEDLRQANSVSYFNSSLTSPMSYHFFFLRWWYLLVVVLASHLTISSSHPLLYLTTWACSLVLFAFTICFFIESCKYLNGAILIKLLLPLYLIKLAWHLSNVKDEYASHEKTRVSVLSDFSGLLVPTGIPSKQVTDMNFNL